jgi:hypothetical protein
MPSSRNLKGIAAGLAGSFVSRNNDVEGYWGIGLLCRDAAQTNGVVVLNLSQRLPVPATPSSVRVLKAYAQQLDALLQNAGFSPGVLADAEVWLQFGEPSTTHANVVMFTCRVALADSKGQRYEAIKHGQCWPHNPTRERRSARASGF